MAALTIPESIQAYFPQGIDPAQLWVNYSSQADSLTIYFTGKPVPSIWDDIDDFAYIGFALEDNESVTGLLIEHFSQWLIAPQQKRPKLQPA